MYKKKKLAQKKHRKNKARIKALKAASLSKAKPKKKIVSAPIEVEKKPVSKKKPAAKKTAAKKPAAKKTAAKKPAAKKTTAKKPAAKKTAAKKPAAKKTAAKKPATKAKK